MVLNIKNVARNVMCNIVHSIGIIGGIKGYHSLISKLRSPTHERISPKIPAVSARAVENVRQPCPRQKTFEEYRCEGRQIISPLGAPACLAPTLAV
jgi:hypothetical protein